MSYQVFAAQIDQIFKEASGGGDEAFYQHLKRRLESLSESWVPKEGELSAEDFSSLLVKKQACLAALQAHGPRVA